MTPKTPAVVLLSGGLDSATVLAIAVQRYNHTCYCLTFDYGQRHRCELEASKAVARAGGAVEHRIVKLDPEAFGTSSLLGHRNVPKDRSMEDIAGLGKTTAVPSTYVPARNLIFLSFATAWAENLGASAIFIGANASEGAGYPDDRPEFLQAFALAANLATVKGLRAVVAPLLGLTKQEIIHIGVYELKRSVDYSITHTCYSPLWRRSGSGILDPMKHIPCGHCDACLLRRNGFLQNGLTDPLKYLD